MSRKIRVMSSDVLRYHFCSTKTILSMSSFKEYYLVVFNTCAFPAEKQQDDTILGDNLLGASLGFTAPCFVCITSGQVKGLWYCITLPLPLAGGSFCTFLTSYRLLNLLPVSVCRHEFILRESLLFLVALYTQGL